MPKRTPLEKTEIRTYRAASLREALALVRQELGPAAAVTRTREVAASGFWNRLTGKTHIEVTAAREPASPRADHAVPATAAKRAPAAFADERAFAGIDLSRKDQVTAAVGTDRYGELFRDPASQPRPGSSPRTRAMPGGEVEHAFVSANHAADIAWSAATFQLFTELLEAEVEIQLARDLLAAVIRAAPASESDQPELLRARLARHLTAEFPVSGPITTRAGQRRVVALIGPTGVGKTTTIAKLAANARLRENRRVGLLTMDTFRIAAVDQLRTYSEIIELPLEIVTTPREVSAALQKLGDLDLVLIDTAGRGPRDWDKLQELNEMLAAARPDETHLVLSATASGASLKQTAEHFAAVGYERILLTKLDEAISLGSLATLARAARTPFSYTTHGQNVPADIAVAESGDLAQRTLRFAEHIDLHPQAFAT